MKHSERFALNEWLSEYPHDLPFDDVIQALLDGSDDVAVWQWFECMPPDEIVENIDDTRCHFENVLDGMKWGVDLARLTEEETNQERAQHEKI